LQQILLNFVGNAIKYTPRGGTVELSAEISPEGEPVFVVADTGPGMPRERIGQVLHPLETGQHIAREGGAARGLGLPISKALAEQHGGSLRLECPAGGGTRESV